MRTNEEVVFMAGAGHSGSTLLGLVLGAHPRAFYAGEANKSRFLGDEKTALRKRTCKVCGPSCPVWGDLVVEGDLYEALSARTQRPIVVDSTKELSWIEAQAADLSSKGVRLALVSLSRDGRAVLASGLRKNPEADPRELSRAWVAQIEASAALAQRFEGRVTAVRYEALATAPEPTIRSLTDALGWSFEPAMLTPWSSEQHPLGGNAGTQSLLVGSRTHKDGALPVSGDKRRYYEDHPRDFLLDTRWRSELSSDAVRAFEEIAGQTNRAHAWDEEGDV